MSLQATQAQEATGHRSECPEHPQGGLWGRDLREKGRKQAHQGRRGLLCRHKASGLSWELGGPSPQEAEHQAFTPSPRGPGGVVGRPQWARALPPTQSRDPARLPWAVQSNLPASPCCRPSL